MKSELCISVFICFNLAISWYSKFFEFISLSLGSPPPPGGILEMSFSPKRHIFMWYLDLQRTNFRRTNEILQWNLLKSSSEQTKNEICTTGYIAFERWTPKDWRITDTILTSFLFLNIDLKKFLTTEIDHWSIWKLIVLIPWVLM